MPRLLSVNVGLPSDIVWQGKTVNTAIWKSPVTGPRMARRRLVGFSPISRAEQSARERRRCVLVA
ncbi:hypothetical protein [Rhizobium tubonense]|uniref:hypothetical protein n=1 Tax=Rhizobium tubonense TaxID=484088 RepID=UPI0011B7C1C4|nr:hypothetical protein [Rhizobium tubonense]